MCCLRADSQTLVLPALVVGTVRTVNRDQHQASAANLGITVKTPYNSVKTKQE